MKNIHLIKEEYIKCGDCNKYYLCTTCGAQCGSEGHFIESTKQETTLDEAAERYSQGWDKGFLYSTTSINAFKAGAEWQAERMYSEEEVKSAYAEGGFAIMRYLEGKECLDVDKWFEQFKKK